MKKSLVLFLVVCSVQVVFPVKKKKKGGDFFKSVTRDVSKAVTSGTKVGAAVGGAGGAVEKWAGQAVKDTGKWSEQAYTDVAKYIEGMRDDLDICFNKKFESTLKDAGIGAGIGAGAVATIAVVPLLECSAAAASSTVLEAMSKAGLTVFSPASIPVVFTTISGVLSGKMSGCLVLNGATAAVVGGAAAFGGLVGALIGGATACTIEVVKAHAAKK